MRLTNHIRDQIVTNVMSKLPKEQTLLYYQEKIKPLVEKEFFNLLPEDIQMAWKGRNYNFIHLAYCYLTDIRLSIAVPYSRDGGKDNLNTIVERIPEVQELRAEYKRGIAARSEAIQKLRLALGSCQTLKVLKERYPELTEFIPERCSPASVTIGTPMIQNALSGFKSLGLSMKGPDEI